MERPVSFCRLPRDQPGQAGEERVRLILENSTVCLISRRISLLCPVGSSVLAFWGWGGWVAVSLTMILTDVSFVQSGDVALIDSRCSCLLFGVGVGG